MTKMSFAQRIDVWRTLSARPADLADEVPGLAELRGELATILEEVQKTSSTWLLDDYRPRAYPV